MTYFIFARDGTSRIVLKRDTKEAAEKKARELKELGWFDVDVKVEADESFSQRTSSNASLLQRISQDGGNLPI